MDNRKLNLVWKPQKGQFASGENLYLNRLLIGNYAYNSLQSKEDRLSRGAYIGRIFLPSLTTPLHGESPDAIKAIVEQNVRAWFIEALA